jgi:UDP-glucose 6-dehydrogenase
VNENFRGFGGHCLPKDTKALNNLLQELDLDFGMLAAVLKDNDKVNAK